MKKICLALTAALVISAFTAMTAFAAPAGATTQANGDKTMTFTLGGGSTSGGQNSTPAQPSTGGGTSPTGEQYLTHDEIIQLGREMAAEYGLEWHDGPKKTFDMSVSAQGVTSDWTEFYNISFTQYVEAGYTSIYIEIFHDGNEYVLRIYR